MQEVTLEKPNVGTLRLMCDTPSGESPLIKHVAFGEYETPTGEFHALTRKKVIGIMQLATSVEQAMLIVGDDAPEGPEWE